MKDFCTKNIELSEQASEKKLFPKIQIQEEKAQIYLNLFQSSFL